jgi:hypothetical protein
MNFLRTTKLRQEKTMRDIKSSFVIPRLSFAENITLVLSILLLFMQPLKNAIPVFSYIDEFTVLFSFAVFVLNRVKRHSISIIEGKIIVAFFLFIIVGTFGNAVSKLDRSSAAILTDILSYGKFFMMILGGLALFDSLKNVKWIFSIVVKLVRSLVVLGLVLAILNQIMDLGMRDDIRYGMYCFSYIYDTAAIFSWYCYMFILILSIDLLNGINREKITYVILNMCLWLFTGRSRGFAFCAIYIMLVLLLRMYEIKKKQLKIKIGYFVMLGLLGIIVAWNQLIFYFTTTTEARSILLYVGINLFKKYFPLGAGLATFGTAAAQKYYSPIYGIYGLSNRYGFTFDNPLYLTDNFWPAVIGETGLIGLMIFFVALYFAFKYLYDKCNQNNMARVIIIFFIATILSSSIATSIFAQNATVADVFYICMIPAILREGKNIYG